MNVEIKPRISVLIICYNQENLIRRALESLIEQRDYLFEICISDDNSQDNTWNILLEYQKYYPALIKLNRNNPNLGIFQNYEKVCTRPTGEIVYLRAGDNEAGKDWFKTVQEFISERKIDYFNELFCIYGDYRCIYPNGDSFVFHNSLVVKSNNLLKLSLRGLIGSRGCCYSRKIMDNFRKVSQGRSHIAEDAQDRQLQIFSKHNYYIPHVGSVYYANIGVSAHLDEKTMRERAKIRPYAISLFQSWGCELDKKDLIYSLEFFPAYEWMLFQPRISNILKVLYLFFKCLDPQIKSNGVILRTVFFAVLRRLPHKKPIVFN